MSAESYGVRPAPRPWAARPILDFWRLVDERLASGPRRERHFPGGCRVSAWDFGERQALVVEGPGGLFSRHLNEAPSA
jgi:hypothetical protein